MADHLIGDQLVATARDIATSAHVGQTDQAGNDYIAHPARVAAALDSADAQAAGWLHDVLEDTDVTAADLAAAGIPPHVIEAVEALSHTHGEPEDDYLARIAAAGPLAVAVKLADMGDNADEGRLALIGDDAKRERLTAKYARRTTKLRELAGQASP